MTIDSDVALPAIPLGAPHKPLWEASALAPSAFQLLAVHWHDYVLERSDLRNVLTAHWIDNASIFYVPEAARLRTLLGCAPRQWEFASGAAYLGGVPAKRLLAPNLRYCPQCLAAGWHCAMFQHVAVRTCPLHRAPLLQGCPGCDKPITLEPASIATHQNFCPHCSVPFVPMAALRVRRVLGPEDPEAFARLAAALTPAPTCDLAAFKSDLTAQELLAADRTTALACAAHRSWPTGVTPGLRWFAQSTRMLASSDILPIGRMNELANAGRIAAFETLLACLNKGGNAVEEPDRYLIASSRGGARVDIPIDTCSAAFVRTALALEMPEVLPGQRPVRRLAPLYTEWMPMQQELVASVAAAQVYNLFVLNLVQLRRICDALDVAWNWAPHPASFSPPWRLWRRGGEIVFEMRQRVSEESLPRFVRRYAHARLRSAEVRLFR